MLIDIKTTVKPEDSRTHIRYPFTLDQPAHALRIRFEYSPKLLEDDSKARRLLEQSMELYVLPEQRELAIAGIDRYLPLSNLITLSVDDPDGYRGACHRHDPKQQFLLSHSEASPGLAKGRIGAGEWTITLSFHSIVTEECTYHLEAWIPEEEEKS
ncbi:hypothetical protein ACFOLF_18675 [Paenibacillus sepulcri]